MATRTTERERSIRSRSAATPTVATDRHGFAVLQLNAGANRRLPDAASPIIQNPSVIARPRSRSRFIVPGPKSQAGGTNPTGVRPPASRTSVPRSMRRRASPSSNIMNSPELAVRPATLIR